MLLIIFRTFPQEDDLSTLGGDFFVYSDVFSEGIPAYWSGYFSTRPFMKQLSRELEANLRAAEILFTVGYQTSKVRPYTNLIRYPVNHFGLQILMLLDTFHSSIS